MPLPMIGKVLVGMTLLTAVVLKDGIIEVNVQEHQPGGSHVHLYVPATVATWGVYLVPQRRLQAQLRRRHEDLAVARAILQDMEKLPDAVLVEVESPREQVRVAVHNGNFVVDAHDENETAHVQMPIRAARKVVEDLETETPPTT